MIRICIVEPDGCGGLAHFAHQLAEALAAAGAEVTLLTARDYELADRPHRSTVVPLLRLWSPVETVPTSPLRRALHRARRPFRRAVRAGVLIREWNRLTAYVGREAPDVVLFSVIRFPFQLVHLRRLRAAGIALVQICHEFETREEASATVRRLHVRLSRAVYACFSVIFFLSEANRRAFLRTFPIEAARTRLLPHGPELLFEPTAEGVAALHRRYHLSGAERVVLFFGGLRPSKGVPDLVDAFARMAPAPDTRLIIAGYPSRQFDVEGLVRRAAEAGVRERTVFDLRYLPLDEVGALLTIADVVVFPYRSASASGAVTLAQTLGRPVVACATGGLGEVVEDGVSGRLVPSGDVPALADAITGMLDDPDAAATMAARARHAALEERSWAEVARRVLDAVAPLAADDGRAAPGPADQPVTPEARRRSSSARRAAG
jgi:glycosyltransferase involved in cell wall biosynthesis